MTKTAVPITISLTLSEETAALVEQTLRTAGDLEAADRLAALLAADRSEAWVLASDEENEDGYQLLLTGSLVHTAEDGTMTYAPEPTLAERIAEGDFDISDADFGFDTADGSTALFREEDKDRFDLSSLPEGVTLDWQLAPTRSEGDDAFEWGNTEIYHCEGLVALGTRADAMREGREA